MRSGSRRGDNPGDRRITAGEFLGMEADALGDVEIVDGRVVQCMAQSEMHDVVIRRLASAFEASRPADGPCMRVRSDVAVRLRDSDDGELNIRYPDILIRDCEPYEVNTVVQHLLLVVEIASKSTIDDDEGPKMRQYARSGIPVYLLVRFDKNWQTISQIDEYRLDWSGLRYAPYRVHRDRLVLDNPINLDIVLSDLQVD